MIENSLNSAFRGGTCFILSVLVLCMALKGYYKNVYWMNMTAMVLCLLFSVIKVDEFTRRLWNIYETVQQEGVAQVTF